MRIKSENKLFGKTVAGLLACSVMLVGIGCGGESANKCNHNYVREKGVLATCTQDGRKLAWYCPDCDTRFTDNTKGIEITEEELIIPATGHDIKKIEAKAPTCEKLGNSEYYTCNYCKNCYSDEAATVEISKSSTVLAKSSHDLTYHAAVKATEDATGNKEYWSCSDCSSYFADVECKEEIGLEDTVTYFALDIPDFLVEVEEGREPVVLQITDPQIMPGYGDVETKCYAYIRETINATNPDLILATGDLIYGEFDHDGAGFVDFVEFMDSFEIPWAPVFGNHDNESNMGVDWQCEQFKNAEYCLFEQRTLTGNGNYSVGISQGGELTRVFYMLDTNGCHNASSASLANGHTTSSEGLAKDQVEWFTSQIQEIKNSSPETKFSVAYHIQQYAFKEAFEKYGFTNSGTLNNPINIDKIANKDDTDFGFIGRDLKGPWDINNLVWDKMKELGVDSIFCGHEHCNNASVVYDGVRFQFGQKSSTYDRYNAITMEGEIFVGGYGAYPENSIPIMGGTVIKLSQDGTIINGYIYYVESAREALGLNSPSKAFIK